jgi:hypothetical protein
MQFWLFFSHFHLSAFHNVSHFVLSRLMIIKLGSVFGNHSLGQLLQPNFMGLSYAAVLAALDIAMAVLNQPHLAR